MKNLENFVDKYMSVLQHFIEEDCGGWALKFEPDSIAKKNYRISKSEVDEILKVLPECFKVSSKNLLERTDVKFPDRLLAIFWKKRFCEKTEELSRLYALIDDLYSQS